MIQPAALIFPAPVPAATTINAWDLATQTYNPVVATGTDRIIQDANKHVSSEFLVRDLRKKLVIVKATQALTPGTLKLWIELSPFDSDDDDTFWSAIGGGGGAQDPVNPVEQTADGSADPYTILLPWSIPSEYARLAIQASDLVVPNTWSIIAYLMGQD